MSLNNKQEVSCRREIIIVIIVAIVLLSASHFYSSVSAFSLESVIHHQNKVFSKKQDSRSNSNDAVSSNTKRSDSSNNERNLNINIDKKNNQLINHGTDTGSHNILGAMQPTKKEGQQQQATGENIAPPVITAPAPMPSIICEQGSNCTDQQGLNDQDRSSTSSTSTTSSASTSQQQQQQQDGNNNDNNDNSTPFVLSLPFP